MEFEMNLTKKVTLESSVVQVEGMPSTHIGEEIAFMNVEKSKYYGLDSIGTRIWHAIEKPKYVREIVAELLEEYNVEKEICEEHVLELLQKLVEEELVRIV